MRKRIAILGLFLSDHTPRPLPTLTSSRGGTLPPLEMETEKKGRKKKRKILQRRAERNESEDEYDARYEAEF